ncbi:MAG: aminotransferase class V-fold PLP-dependent enzyme, partial [Clostridia bacterium]|nr:aminotransferase class V-fold PLP-dependent enzyme [Clostridia bacterium]
KLFKVNDPENIVFTSNASHGLNIAINSIVNKNKTVLMSGFEHNSVSRPLNSSGAKIIIAGRSLFDQDAVLTDFEKSIPRVDAVVCTHVSNVFGYVLPVYELGELCRRMGKAFIVDASQSAGTEELNFTALNADFAAMPGHKGLLGPQGTGLLICKNEAKPLLYGGSGSNSLLPSMPEYLPDRLEAGTHNVAGIAGLNEGIRYILKKGAGNIRRHERMLLEEFVRPLQNMEGVRMFYSPDRERQSALLSLVPEKISCEELGERLGERGIAVRTGLHCAPAAHKNAGTIATGTVRFSFSPFISAAQARTASHEVKKILKKA